MTIQSVELSAKQILEWFALFATAGIPIAFGDSPAIDAFARLRVSMPQTQFDSKQLHDKLPLFWDESITDTSGNATSVHSTVNAATTLHVETDDIIIRQTKTHWNYQPGKSQLVVMTGVLGVGGVGVIGRIGSFTAINGLFFQINGTTIGVGLRKASSDTIVEQSDWNLDKMDGTGSSGITLDFTKSQIFMIDFEWLASGRIRYGFIVNGIPVYCHEITHLNVLTGAYMSTCNLPLRYEIRTTDVTAELIHICSSVASEGGLEENGVIRSMTTAGVHVNANVVNTIYAVLGIRLKAAILDAVVKPLGVSLLAEGGGDNFEFLLLLNPTLAVDLTWADEADSAVQRGIHNGADPGTNTIAENAWDVLLDSGYGNATGGGGSSGSIREAISSALALGSTIGGTPDEIILAVRPLTANVDIQASMSRRELL